MKQKILGAAGFERKTKLTRKRAFHNAMRLVVPWAKLVALMAPHALHPGAKGGRAPFAVSGYRGVEKREEIEAAHPRVNWHIAMMPGKRKAMDKSTLMGAILEQLAKAKASIRAKLEHLFRVIKRRFGFVKVKYRGLAKKAANLVKLLALARCQRSIPAGICLENAQLTSGIIRARLVPRAAVDIEQNPGVV